METYKNIPKLSTIEKIAQALNVDPIILFIKSDKSSSTKENHKPTISQELKERLKKQIISNLDKSIDEVFQQI